MSLTVFDNYLQFVGKVLETNADLTSGTDAIELESVLVSHGIILLYARMEQCFQQAMERKCNCCTDVDVRTFALSVKRDKTGKLSMEAVKSTCKRFGINHKEELTPALDRLNVAESWDSVVTVRQRVAHYAEPANCTLKDLRQYYEDIRKVLGCICKALRLAKQDVSAICKLIEYPPTASD